MPWRAFTKPRPIGSGEATTSAPRYVKHAAAPTMSTIASTAPTSWKWTSSSGILWTAASASPRRRKMRRARSFVRRRAARSDEHRVDLAEGALGLRRLEVDVERGRDDPRAVDVAAVDVEALEGERRDRALDDEERHAEIEERRDRHVAGDAAEGVEEEELALAVALGEEVRAGAALVGVGVVRGLVAVAARARGGGRARWARSCSSSWACPWGWACSWG
jgi:hypothetical protein